MLNVPVKVLTPESVSVIEPVLFTEPAPLNAMFDVVASGRLKTAVPPLRLTAALPIVPLPAVTPSPI